MLNLIKAINTLKRIEGSGFSDLGRQYDVVWILFENGNDMFCLNIRCSWRIFKNGSLYLGSRDIYKMSPSYINKAMRGYTNTHESYDWNKYGANIFDRKARELINSREAGMVSFAGMNKQNDLQIKTDSGIMFQTVIDSSCEDEQWRFFKKTGSCENDAECKIITSSRKITIK